MELEPNERREGFGYENLPGTEMLASNCVFCGRPLADPDSVTQGCGPDCAEKYGMFAFTGEVDMVALDHALKTAPATLRDKVAPDIEEPAIAMKHVIHTSGYHWERGSKDALQILGSAIEISRALGYPKVAEKIMRRFVEGADRQGGNKGLVVKLAPGSGKWQVELPYMSNYATWRGIFDAMRQLRAQMFKSGNKTAYVFEEKKWLEVLNVFARHMPGQIGVLPSGELFAVPSEPLPLPGPPGAAVTGPQHETREKPPVVEFKKGMVIELQDGSEAVVGYVSANGASIGVMPADDARAALKKFGRITPGRAGYQFLGTDEVLSVRAPQLAIEEVEKTMEQPGSIVRAPRQMPANLLPHQPECVVWCDTVQRGILALEQGLGKTVVAATVIDKPAVVVCPASLRINWVREINRWRPDLTVASVGVEIDSKGRVRGTSSLINDEALKADVVVVNYETIIERVPVDYELVRMAKKISEAAEARLSEDQFAFGADRNAYDVIRQSMPAAEFKDLAPKSVDALVRGVAKRLKIEKYARGQVKPALPPKGPPKICSNLQKLLDRGLQTLVVDEAQYVKELDLKFNRSTKKYEPSASCSARAAAVWHLSKASDRRFFLTGTPIKNYTYELWALLTLVDPERWNNFWEYAKRYCAAYQTRFGWEYKGTSNADELNSIINGKFMLRKRKDELDLPEKSRSSIEITLDEESADDYRLAARDFAAWVQKSGGPEAVKRLGRAKAIVKLTGLRRLAAVGKARALAQQADEFLSSTKRPLVIMGWHKDALEVLVEEIRKAGWRVGTITGDDDAASRQIAMDEFQIGVPAEAPPEERKYLDVLVCSIAAAGVGLTLTRSSDMYFLERAWTPSDLVQAEDRIHRISQVNKCSITYFDGAGTVDMYIAKLLLNKASTAAAVIDGEDLSQDQVIDRVLGELFGDFSGLTQNPSIDDEYADDSEERDWMLGVA